MVTVPVTVYSVHCKTCRGMQGELYLHCPAKPQLYHFTQDEPYEEIQCNLRKAGSGQSR